MLIIELATTQKWDIWGCGFINLRRHGGYSRGPCWPWSWRVIGVWPLKWQLHHPKEVFLGSKYLWYFMIGNHVAWSMVWATSSNPQLLRRVALTLVKRFVCLAAGRYDAGKHFSLWPYCFDFKIKMILKNIHDLWKHQVHPEHHSRILQECWKRYGFPNHCRLHQSLCHHSPIFVRCLPQSSRSINGNPRL